MGCGLMNNYLNIALVLVCFYDVLIVMLIPSSATFLVAEDGGCARMVVYMLSIGIGLYALSKVGFKQSPNIWMSLFIIFMVFSSFHSPNITIDGAFIPRDSGLFNFKPMFEVIIYFLLFMGLFSLDITQKSKYRIGAAFSWIGIVYSTYIIFQHFGMDQFYKIIGTSLDHLSRNPLNGGFISQPVYASAVLVICLPFVIKHHGYFSILLIIAEVLTGNRSGMVAIAISGLYLVTCNLRVTLYAFGAYIAIIASMLAILLIHPHMPPLFDDSGRMMMWKKVIIDFIHPAFPGIHQSYVLTGTGIGAFSTLFPFYHPGGWNQAHNEYLEIFYSLSFVGLFLMLRTQWEVFKTANRNTITFTAALIAISVFAATNPVWHVPQLQFLTVFLIGMIYNKENSYVGTARI